MDIGAIDSVKPEEVAQHDMVRCYCKFCMNYFTVFKYLRDK